MQMPMWIKRFFGAGYDAAERSNKQQRLQWGRQQEKDEDRMVGEHDKKQLRMRCRNLQRNSSTAKGIIERFSDNVVGSGITPQAKTSDPAWNDEAEEFFHNWGKIADSRGRVSFREMQKLTIEERLVSGDVGYVMTSNGQLQPIEGERILTPEKKGIKNTVDGIKYGSLGNPVGYYVFKRGENGCVDAGQDGYSLVPRENFIFCMKPVRFDQGRGIPDFAPIINDLQYVDEIQRATLEKCQMDAYKAWFIGSENSVGPGNLGARNSTKGVDARTYEKQLSGQTIYGNPGDRVESLASNTPNPQYVAFMEQSLRQIGAALGLPYEFILLDFSKGSYSSSRAALLQTYRTFTDWQEWLTQAFLQRVWNWRIAKAIKEGKLSPAPLDDKGVSEWYKVEWSFPEFGWVDPQNEAQANLLEWQLGTNTVTQMNRKKGRDVEDVFDEKAKEIAYAEVAARKAGEIVDGLNLSWRDIISAQIPGQTSAPAAVTTTGNDDEANTGTE